MPIDIVAELALVCGLAFVLALYAWRKQRSSLSLPPGPNGLPLLGNTLDMQGEEPWETARQWGKQYGPLVCVNSFGMSIIYVNSLEIAIELFEKRGSIYSSRPINTMEQLGGWDWLVGLMPYGSDLKKSRHLLHRFLQPNIVPEYSELLTQTMHRMLIRLLKNPEDLASLLRQSAGEAIIMLTYGYLPLEKHDPFIELAEKALQAIAVAGGSFFLVNVFPILQYLPSWFPGAGFKKVAQEGYRLSMRLYQEPYRIAKSKLDKDIATPSILSKLLASGADKQDETLIAKVTGMTYAAGSDAIVSTLHSFFLAMLLHPDVQKRAQDELDRVVGKDVLPTLEDRQNLPYVDAIVKETLRWQPVGPLAFAHKADADDEAMTRDPDLYPESDKFIPERWLPTKGSGPPPDIYKLAFGFGRRQESLMLSSDTDYEYIAANRICPGRHFANCSIFIGIASALATLNITKALDENGAQIMPKVEYTPLIKRHPKPFKCAITPRSEKIGSVLTQAIESGICDTKI